MPGPAPSPFARRRNVRPDWISLPKGGYSGPVPDWPLSEALFEKLPELPSTWVELWRLPQAAQWAAEGFERIVARYAIMLVESERPRARATLLGEVRQLEDRLGMSPMAMKRLQWEIGDGEASRAGKVANVVSISDRRDF